MKEQAVYVAEDGTRFDSSVEAIRYESLCARCAELEALLGSHPDSQDDRVKHPRLNEYREAVVALCRELFPREAIFALPPTEIHPFSWAGRFLSECAPKPVNHLWWRLMCVGEDGYEYQQPFYALNPGKFREFRSPFSA